MPTDQLFATLFGIVVGAAAIYWIAYLTGRLRGYRCGLETGTTLASRVQHMKGMNDGYALALQHTAAQRAEYMNNVLLKTGVMSRADIEAERQRRFRLQLEG